MTSPLANNRGVALLSTLLVLVFMVIFTLDFANVIRRNLTGAAYSMNRIDLQERARSAVNLVLALLYAGQQRDKAYTSLHDPWANQEWLQQKVGTLFDDGTIELAIEDHSGHLQINSLVTPQGEFEPEQKARLLRLLTSEGASLSEEEAEQILDALKDWLDADDETTGFGAENSFYHSLPIPYDCRNGPVASLDELALVRGISQELLHGTEDHPGISQFLTPYGNDGLVNINTASPTVLRTLGEGISQATVDSLLRHRADSSHDLSVTDWYKDVTGDLNIPGITVNSCYFGIRITAGLRNQTLRAAAEVYLPGQQPAPQTAPAPPAIISWQVE